MLWSELNALVSSEVQEMLQKGAIEPVLCVEGHYISTIFLVDKKIGDLAQSST